MKRCGGIAVLLGLALAPCASAAVLMLDFGPTATTASYLSNSPYHTANPSFTGTSWNMTSADVAAGSLLWSDGTTAAGVSLNVGMSGINSQTIDLSATPSSSALGGQINTGVYAGNSAGKDGIFGGGSSAQMRHVGIQLGGLAGGTYEVFVTTRNTSTLNASNYKLYTGVSGAAGNYSVSGYTMQEISFANGSSVATGAWVPEGSVGENYAKFTVTLAPGQYLNVASVGTAGMEQRGFLNTVQVGLLIVVPEPSSVALLGSGLALLTTLWRRRAQRAAFA